MESIRGKFADLGMRRIAFSVVVLVFVGFFVLSGGWRVLADAVAAWFEPAVGLHEEFEPAHRIHFFALPLLFWPLIVGLLIQLKSPEKQLAGQLMALLPFVALFTAFAITDFWEPATFMGVFGAVTLLTTLLHPSGRELLGSISVSRVNRVLLVLALVAAVPLLAYVGTQVGLQTGAIEASGHDHAGSGHAEVHEEHIEAGHFTLMTAVGLFVIGLGLLSSLQQPGWWLPAWFAGLLAAFLGLASVVFPDAASSGDLIWALGSIAWGIAFIVAAEITQESESPTLLGAWRARSALGQ